MVKHGTVLKRIFADAWRPALQGAAFMVAVIGVGFAAQTFFDIEWYMASQSVFFFALFIWGLKGWYDYKKWQIESEQEQMLRDLGKKND